MGEHEACLLNKFPLVIFRVHTEVVFLLLLLKR